MKNKRLLLGSLAIAGALTLASCGEIQNGSNSQTSITPTSETTPSTSVTPSSTKTSKPGYEHTASGSITPVYNLSQDPSDSEYQSLLSDKGYAGINGKMIDFSQYENTDAYVKVKTAEELANAIKAAKYTYSATDVTVTEDNGYVVRNNTRKNETNWTRAITKGLYLKNSDGTYTKIPADTPFSDTTYTATMTYYEDSPYSIVSYNQELTSAGTVHVIEIENDIDLGWNKIGANAQSSGVVNNFTKSQNESKYTMSSMFKECGMSPYLVQNTANLLIYSKNGAKLTHGGFKVNYSNNIVFRNLEMDEMWQWEDTSLTSSGKVGDYDAFGWAYFKIGFSENIWIDHCEFGKSYDGQIDISNPTFNTMGTYSYAPYQADGSSGVHISWCKFKGGSDDTNGYLYKMMREIEEDYQKDGNNYLYYKALRNSGLTFDDILYGVAIPQKKAFLDGDSGDEYFYNTALRTSIANCYFKNIEDRLPKVRGGVAYMYNTIIDNFEYIDYRTKIRATTAQGAVTGVNSTWKLAMVSQGIVCGNGGSVAAKNCIFRGIESLLKNNDSSLTNNSKKVTTTSNGGYSIINCSYQFTSNGEVSTTVFPNSTPEKLSNIDFTWRTTDEKAPFTVDNFDLTKLSERLLNTSYGAGVNAKIAKYMLKTN